MLQVTSLEDLEMQEARICYSIQIDPNIIRKLSVGRRFRLLNNLVMMSKGHTSDFKDE